SADCVRGGGGSSSNPPPVANADPGGIYTGTFVSSTTGQSGNVVGIVTETGEARFFDPGNGNQFAGTITTSGNNVSGTFTGYAPFGFVFLNNQAVAQFSLAGTISQGVSISGTYSGGGDQGTVSLTDDPHGYDTGSSLSSLVGTWIGTNPDGSTLTVTIQSDGSYFGQDTDGCTYAGNFTLINSSFDAYDVSLTETCAGNAVSASGLASLGTDQATSKPAIVFSLSNSQNSVTGEIVLQ
ncbi:MAG: hypothetical protein ACREQ5_40495, partial [Candidatus Dormibacteria bacterium]